MPADEVLPYVRPQEWVALLDRLRFNVGAGKKKLASRTIKGVAVRLAWYADYTRGTGIYPGLARTAVGCEVDYDTAKRVFAVLRELRLLTLVKTSRGPQGRRRSDVSDEYRLTIPPDLLDQERVVVLDPAQFEKEIAAVRERKRGRSGPSAVEPVDNSELQGCIPAATTSPDERVAVVIPLRISELQGCVPDSCGGASPLPTTKEQAPTTNHQYPVPAEPHHARARANENPPLSKPLRLTWRQQRAATAHLDADTRDAIRSEREAQRRRANIRVVSPLEDSGAAS